MSPDAAESEAFTQRRHLLLAVAGSLAGLGHSPPALAARRPIHIETGPGSFEFVDAQGDASKRMTVYTHLPGGLSISEARIAFVMHGHGKNAPGYRDHWAAQADKFKFMVIAPHFDAQQWGDGDYSYASLFDAQGQPADPARWSFSLIEHLFDTVRQATGNRSERYFLYGHSEGGQFAHRLLMLLPQARVQRAVVANPGWYTLPSDDIAYPYGLKGTPASTATLKTCLARDVVLMLGEKDKDPDDPNLRKSRQAMAQGSNRFERGHHYFDAMKKQAESSGTRFGWRLETVPGGTHSDARMAPAAAAALMAA